MYLSKRFIAAYDNALAESMSGLFKLEVIEYLKSDCTGLADV